MVISMKISEMKQLLFKTQLIYTWKYCKNVIIEIIINSTKNILQKNQNIKMIISIVFIIIAVELLFP